MVGSFFRGINWMSSLGTESMTKLTPHLVRLHETEKLYQLARDKNPEARQELSSAVTDLFSTTELSVREQEIVSDILITMLRQAEVDLRMAIAERLAGLEKAPLRVILYLSNDEIDVAKTVLARSPVLEDMDLMYIIQTRDSPYWQAIAHRPTLNAPVVRALVETHDEATATVLVNNEEITFPQDVFVILAEMAQVANDIRAPLLRRRDIPRDLAAALYAHVGQRLETELKQGFGDVPAEITAAVQDVTQEFVNAGQDEFTPSLAMISAARTLASRGQLTVDTMMRALKVGQIASFIAQLSVFTGIAVEKVKVILQEEGGETLAAICRISRADKKIYLKMFLLTQRFRSGERLVDPQTLNRALNKFDQMALSDCQRLIDQHKK